jgi:hypothetical protein
MMGWRPCAAALLCALAAGCDLAEVTTAPGEDVIVVEGVLRTDFVTQQVLLHRTVDGALAGGVPGARVTITGSAGDVHRLVAGTGCFQIDALYARSDSLDFEGSCYVTAGQDAGWVTPGRTYDLLVETPDGRAVIDTGLGARFGGYGPRIEPLVGRLGGQLAEAGAMELSAVLFTHLHQDHARGATWSGELTFPAASGFAHAAEVEFWSSSERSPATPSTTACS